MVLVPRPPQLALCLRILYDESINTDLFFLHLAKKKKNNFFPYYFVSGTLNTRFDLNNTIQNVEFFNTNNKNDNNNNG